MKKLLATVLIVCCIVCIASPTFADNEKPSESSPFRISFWPGVWTWPKNVNIYGLALGLPASYNDEKTVVAGVDFAFIFSQTNHVKGVQASILNMGTGSDGLQVGAANLTEKVSGMQGGFFNQTDGSSMFQFGIINQATNSKGIQVGILNIMDNGFIPVCPIINFGFGDKPAEEVTKPVEKTATPATQKTE